MAASNTRRNQDAHPDDLYQTDPKAVKLAITAGVFKGIASAYDPCNGFGALSNELKKIGIKVDTSDLIDYGIGDRIEDFLNPEIELDNPVDAIVFNPPFKMTTDFVTQALKLNDRLIMFNRVTFLETVSRAVKIQSTWGLTDIYYHAARVGCTKGTGEKDYKNSVFYAWYNFEPKKYNGITKSHWII